MEHIEIAPLARRLAEENNVEWRRLRGSGERGRVVERDVLEFLARVMAGEEDLDPTPEPVPEGMQAWPEGDVRAFERERTSEVVPPIDGTSTVDDEIFLLGGDDDAFLDLGSDAGEWRDGGGRLAPTSVADHALERAPIDRGVIGDYTDDDDLLVEGDDVFAEPTPGDRRESESESARTTDGRSFDPLGDSRAHDDLPDLFDDRPTSQAWNEGPVFGDEGLGERRPMAGPDLKLDEAPGGEGSGGASGSSLAMDVGEPKGAYWSPESGTVPSDLHTGPEGAEPLDLDDGADEPEVLDLGGDEGVHHVPDDTPDHVHDHVVGGEDGAQRDAREHVARVDAAPSAVRPGTDTSLQVTTRSSGDVHPHLPLVHHGVVFRRQVNLSSLVAAQADVARDLGLDEPVPLVVFLARAAAKALEQGAHVGVVTFDEHETRTHRVDVLSGSFSDVVRSFLDQVAVGAPVDVGLIVADLSDLELDEAVLHLDAPVLSLGRVLVDTSTGGRRATLVLSGDGIGRDAGRLLARTAELLETPIRVVL